MPSFILSELKTAFQMGFLIFIPFIVVDFVVASSLMSMGMMMMPPVVISMPFKLLLFVLVDGWYLIVSLWLKVLIFLGFSYDNGTGGGVMRHLLQTGLLLSIPILGTATVVGLLVSFVQSIAVCRNRP